YPYLCCVLFNILREIAKADICFIPSPDNSDMNVICGSHTVYLSMLLCPIYFNGYNETLMFLNSQHKNPACQGEADWNAKPPVLRFNISLTMEECGHSTKPSPTGTGVFSQFSMVQFVNISGRVSSKDPSNGAITYFQEAMYLFSCRYSLQYLISNTKMNVSGVTLAVKDTDGSFLSTLDMKLYADRAYKDSLGMPIYLKTRVFVQVRASNLTDKFYVLLDRCYATALPIFLENTHFDLFVGCNRDGQTFIDVNGQMQVARFSFEAFRFTKATNLSVSTYYVHCATRLCVKDICPSLIEVSFLEGLPQDIDIIKAWY
uniref:Si:ch73-261i21.5 n=1 Tax=Neogobius melanostomus TaxID=47308 RepID=A0A8C6S4S6_9GOBI